MERKNDRGGGVVGDGLGGRHPQRQSLTIRLPELVLVEIREVARRRGLSITDVVESMLTSVNVRPGRTAAAVDAEPWTALGYRVTRSLAAIDTGDHEAARTELTAARATVVKTLGKIRSDYDAALDGRPERSDDWSGTT